MQPVSRPRLKCLGGSFRWPNGARVGIIFNVAYEGWSDGQTPGIGPMGNPLKPGYFDVNASSWALYGPTRGIRRVLEIAARTDVRMSIIESFDVDKQVVMDRAARRRGRGRPLRRSVRQPAFGLHARSHRCDLSASSRSRPAVEVNDMSS